MKVCTKRWIPWLCGREASAATCAVYKHERSLETSKFQHNSPTCLWQIPHWCRVYTRRMAYVYWNHHYYQHAELKRRLEVAVTNTYGGVCSNFSITCFQLPFSSKYSFPVVSAWQSNTVPSISEIGTVRWGVRTQSLEHKNKHWILNMDWICTEKNKFKALNPSLTGLGGSDISMVRVSMYNCVSECCSAGNMPLEAGDSSTSVTWCVFNSEIRQPDCSTVDRLCSVLQHKRPSPLDMPHAMPWSLSLSWHLCCKVWSQPRRWYPSSHSHPLSQMYAAELPPLLSFFNFYGHGFWNDTKKIRPPINIALVARNSTPKLVTKPIPFFSLAGGVQADRLLIHPKTSDLCIHRLDGLSMWLAPENGV